MKRISIVLIMILIAVVSIGVLSGCDSSEEPSYCDAAFVKDMSKGLEDRWDISNKEDDNNSDEEHGKVLAEAVQAELDRVSEYTGGLFEDTKLQEYAISYINALQAQKDAMEYYDTDYAKCVEQWEEAYDDRCQLIIAINELYPLSIGDKYADELNELVNNGKQKNEQEAGEKALKKEIKNAERKKVDEYLVMVLENTTGRNIETAEIDIEFYDKDDVKIESDMAFLENWKKGEKTKVSFWIYDINYDRYKITLDSVTFED